MTRPSRLLDPDAIRRGVVEDALLPASDLAAQIAELRRVEATRSPDLEVSTLVARRGASVGSSYGDLVDVYGVRFVGRTPTVTVGAGLGASATVNNVIGAEGAGLVTVAASGTTATGDIFTVTFATARANSDYIIQLTPAGSGTAGLQLYISARTATLFTVAARNAPVSGVTYTVYWAVLGFVP